MTMEMVLAQGRNNPALRVKDSVATEPLSSCVRNALDSYFGQLNGHQVSNLYQMVLAEVEQPLLEQVMQHTEGNQTKAAQVLGISRSTLRKKLALYGLD